MLWESRESHNDDLTQLEFHPTSPDRLLSGATDGLVNVFDISIPDEDDALVQVVNHSSIHKAGFLADDAIFALSHDENLAIHPVNSKDEEYIEPNPIQFGDLRPRLSCDYAIDILRLTEGAFLVHGTHSHDQRINLTPLSPSPTWSLGESGGFIIPGGHGEEIVRTIYADEKTDQVYTGGEDGMLRVFRNPAPETSPKSPKSTKPAAKSATQQRYRPY
ncbi:MAG: hypothetical protein Q9227_000324 [Pyrenula ochraceoflavens]